MPHNHDNPTIPGLTLSRKPGESVVLTNRETKEVIAEIIVTEINPSRVRIRFLAPQNIKILRTEVKDKDVTLQSKDELK